MIHFAVHSVFGRGHVRIHVTPVMSSVPALTVCTESGWNASSGDRAIIKRNMAHGAEFWYGMTDAQNNITGIALLLSGKATGCDVVLHKTADRSKSSICEYAEQPGQAHLYRKSENYDGWDSDGWVAGALIAHEFGHLKGCLDDEYSDDRGAWCGHSIMGHYEPTKDMCGSQNHGKDGQWSKFSAPSGPIYGWERFSSKRQVWIKRTATADPSDYYGMLNFDKITPVIEFW